MGDTFLAHHGILGMKWGIRRYQNKDGSLTEEGKRRLKNLSEVNALEGARRKYYSGKTEDVNKATGSARGLISNVKKASKDRERQREEDAKSKARGEIDLSKMSDEELRSAINRLQMETQYKDLAVRNLQNSPEVKAGKDHMSNFLDKLDTVLAVGASAVALANALSVFMDAEGPEGEKPNKKKEENKKQESVGEKAGKAAKSFVDAFKGNGSKTASSGSDKKDSGKIDIFSERTVTDKKIYGQDPMEDQLFQETYDRVYGQDPLDKRKRR